jgi:DNA-binding transcriptional regulator YdaS (Cro superfamily)
MTPEEALQEAIRIAGGQSALGRELGVTQQAVFQWKQAPPQHVITIEDLTGISRDLLRPDIFRATGSGGYQVEWSKIDAGEARERFSLYKSSVLRWDELLPGSSLKASSAEFAVQATARLKTGFAVNHLQAAVKAARDAHRIQSEHVGAAFGSWFDGILQTVPVAIMMAAAALEANASESIEDILDGTANIPVTDSQKGLLSDVRRDKAESFAEKYRRLALILGKAPDPSKVIWEDVGLLTSFRNQITHFDLAWDDDQIRDGKFSHRIRTKVPVADAYEGRFAFPYGLMTYESAKWAIETAKGFSTEFSNLTGIIDRFGSPHLDTKLP